MGLLSRKTRLFDFARGSQHWRHASGQRDIVYQTQAYAQASIKAGKLSESADVTRNTLDLAVSLDLPLLDLYKGSAPAEPISLQMLSLDSITGVADTLWIGEVGSVEFVTHQATIHCLPPLATMRALALKRCWQKACPLVLYSAGPGQCNADRTTATLAATLTYVSGKAVQAAEFATLPDGRLNGGYIEWQVGAATERRFIVGHIGDTLTLLTPALTAVGTRVNSLWGCDHSLAGGCTDHNNTDNYGGQPWIPIKNPFGADAVF